MGNGYYDDDVDFYTETSEVDRLGKGSSLRPFLLSNDLNISSGRDRITESLIDILSTPIGTRFFNPSYGSRIHLLLFEPNDYLCRDSAIDYCKEAIERWEPRITLKNIEAEVDQLVLKIHIYYVINDTGMEGSFVYTIERRIPELS